ncbi:MAG: glycosyltransferase [Bacteroidales bacterium]|nr:glycosyltransferase [Bacteroidales bacterium]
MTSNSGQEQALPATRVAVLIPCYNEEGSIAQVIRDFRAVLPEAVVFVYDNNSSDRTAAVAREAGAVVRHEPLQGKGNVVRRMFREIHADCYLMVDGDGTYHAGDAPRMVELVLHGQTDMVIADRLSTTYFQENTRPFHNLGNRLVRWLINRFWHTDIHDIMTGYRAFSRRFVKLFPVMSPHFEIETEMTIHALDKRFVIQEIPTTYTDRRQGESKLRTYKDGAKILSTIFSLFKEYRPLPFFGILGALLVLVALGLFIPILIEFLHIGLVPRFPTLICAVFIAIAGLMSFFTGVCLDVIIKQDRKRYELSVINFEHE